MIRPLFFKFSHFCFSYIIYLRVRLCARTHAHCLHVYNKVKYQKKYDKYSRSVKILLISKLFLGNIWWFRKMFVLLHSLLRNTISQALKKEFFERFYINRQVVQEAVLDYTLIIIGSMKRLGKKKRTVKQLTSQVY